MNRREFLHLTATAIAAGGIDEALGQQSPATRPATNPSMTARIAQLGGRGVHVHDPSTIIRCKEKYWIFYTGRGVPSYFSTDLLKWQPGPRVFDSQPSWVPAAVPGARGTNFWAPEIVRLGDRYLLYYAVSTFGKNTSAIGLTSTPTLDPADPAHHWTDDGIVVQSTAADQFNTIDPSIASDSAGGLWMSFGSFWSGIKLIQLDPSTGKRIAPDSEMYSLAHANQIEASYLYEHGEYFYLIVNWGFCCRGVQSTYNMRIGRSAKIIGPYLDKEGTDLLQGGGSLLLATDGPFIGPGQAGIFHDGDRDWISMHYYDATMRGQSMLAIRPLNWGDDGWPAVG